MYLDNHVIAARWARGSAVAKNWGDLLNPELIYRLSGAPVAHADDLKGWSDRPVYRVVGSDLGNLRVNEVVWGMGFIRRDAVAKSRPMKVFAVRGPMSREKMISQNIECPSVFGDPAILWPLFYSPKITPKYDVGFIQHFREQGVTNEPEIAGESNTLAIDVCSGLKKFVDSILSCRRIVSSSLHGVICAHSYGIPAHWAKLSDLPIGDDFKFHDYYASIGHSDILPATISSDGELDARQNPDAPGEMKIDPLALIDACPFISIPRKTALKAKITKDRRAGRQGTIYNTDFTRA